MCEVNCRGGLPGETSSKAQWWTLWTAGCWLTPNIPATQWSNSLPVCRGNLQQTIKVKVKHACSLNKFTPFSSLYHIQKSAFTSTDSRSKCILRAEFSLQVIWFLGSRRTKCLMAEKIIGIQFHAHSFVVLVIVLKHEG